MINELETKGYCIIENVLSEEDIDYCKKEFRSWQNTIFEKDSNNAHGI